jgi:hypothetical protein
LGLLDAAADLHLGDADKFHLIDTTECVPYMLSEDGSKKSKRSDLIFIFKHDNTTILIYYRSNNKMYLNL